MEQLVIQGQGLTGEHITYTETVSDSGIHYNYIGTWPCSGIHHISGTWPSSGTNHSIYTETGPDSRTKYKYRDSTYAWSGPGSGSQYIIMHGQGLVLKHSTAHTQAQDLAVQHITIHIHRQDLAVQHLTAHIKRQGLRVEFIAYTGTGPDDRIYYSI